MKDLSDRLASGLLQLLLLIVGFSFLVFSFLLIRDGKEDGLDCIFYGMMCFSMQEIISILRKNKKQ